MRLFGCFVLLALFCLSCQSPAVEKAKDCPVLFLDSLQASQAILEDTVEHFFDKISELDMAIQLKVETTEGLSRKVLLEQYRQFLQKDVGDFSEMEAKMLQNILTNAFQLCQKLSPDFLPNTLLLIKTKGNHYGPSVFYTRQKCIVIPENDLVEPDTKKLLRVMLHELFHIYSRYHPEQRKELYQLIGFRALSGQLAYPAALKNTLLTNPDGINVAYAIRLPDTSSHMQAIPIIRSRYEQFDPALPDFFSYLDFDLYTIDSESGSLQVLSRADGSSTLSEVEKAGFYKQIGDNTNYIIHPDEILADNFVLLTMEGAARDHLLRGMQKIIACR